MLTASVVRFGRRRISVENRTQRRLERPEPRFVIAPSLNCLLENWTTHLLVAEGIESTIILVEFQTVGFERKTQMVKQPANLGFRIFHQAFIGHAVYLFR